MVMTLGSLFHHGVYQPVISEFIIEKSPPLFYSNYIKDRILLSLNIYK